MDVNNFEKFIAKVASGKCASGFVVTLTDPAVSELIGDAGFDFTWLDMEHSPLSLTDVAAHIMALRGTDCAPFVRVADNDTVQIKKVLDLAPAGIIIPMIKSADELKKAIALCRYPQTGVRGCGYRRAIRYGAMDLQEYFEKSKNEPLIIAQIEHIDAVRNLDEILAVEGLGSICIGPNDLSGSINKLGQISDPEVCKLIDTICEKAHKAGVMVGAFAPNVKNWKHRKLDWAALQTDWGAMLSGMQELRQKLEQ